jgi:hypothetical protein
MSKIKIEEMKKSESFFIQINTVKGFTCLDKVGEIINTFYINGEVPLTQTKHNEVLIFNPFENIEQIKIDYYSIEAKIINKKNTDIADEVDFFSKKVKEIFEITKIENIARVGFRLQYSYYFNKLDDRINFLKKSLKRLV